MSQEILDCIVTARTWVGAIAIFLGSFLTLVAAIGLVSRRDSYERMHAASKPQFLGLLLLCVGIVLEAGTWQWVAIAIVIVALQAITVPVGSHLVARAFDRVHRLDEKDD